MGTLATVLAKKKIRTTNDLFRANVTGDIEDVEGILKITRIHVHYELTALEENREEINAAFGAYLQLCPAAQSVIGCINVSHEIRVTGTLK